jgi:hypothetical protein
MATAAAVKPEKPGVFYAIYPTYKLHLSDAVFEDILNEGGRRIGQRMIHAARVADFRHCRCEVPPDWIPLMLKKDGVEPTTFYGVDFISLEDLAAMRRDPKRRAEFDSFCARAQTREILAYGAGVESVRDRIMEEIGRIPAGGGTAHESR